MRKKILYIISKVTDSSEYEYLVHAWDRSRFDLEFLLLNPVPDCNLQRNLRSAGFPCTTILYTSKLESISCLRAVMKYLRTSRPDVVHANLLEASLLGMCASWLTGIGKRVYTRHVASHNHKYHPIKGVFYDRLCNRLAHRIIAITRSTQEVLIDWENVPPEKVVLIYHGFEMKHANRPDPDKLRRLRTKHGLDQVTGAIIGVISRPFDLKGLEHSIPAIDRALRKFPGSLAIFFNWIPTQHSDRYDAMLRTLPAGSWRTVPFETDVIQLYHAFSMFVHVPEDQHAEAFGLVYVEAMMAGAPCVFTRSGIMHDVDVSRLQGVSIVPFKDRDAMAVAIERWAASPPSEEQRRQWADANTAYLRTLLDVDLKLAGLYALYEELSR